MQAKQFLEYNTIKFLRMLMLKCFFFFVFPNPKKAFTTTIEKRNKEETLRYYTIWKY